MSVHYLVTCFGKSAELPSPLLSECAKAMHEKDGWSAWDLISTFLCWSSGAKVCHESLHRSPVIDISKVARHSVCS